MSAKTPVLLILLAITLPAPLAHAADPRVRERVEALEKNARDPFEQKRRESAIRALGRVGTVEAAAALLPLFQDPFEHLRDHATSAWIAMARHENGGPVRAWLATRALADRRPEARRAAVIALTVAGAKDLAPKLAALAGKEKSEQVLAALADAARRLEGAPPLDAMARDLLGSRSGEAVFAAATACGRLGDELAVPALVKALDHKSGRGRAGAVGALLELSALPPEAIEAILDDGDPEPASALALGLWRLEEAETVADLLPRLLQAESWRVRTAAIEGALWIWKPFVIPHLIDALAREPGRLKDDARQALETITGKAMGFDAELWRAWWEGQEDLKLAPRPKPNDAGRLPRGAGGEEGGSVAFFDLPIHSKSLAFVFDLSGSMRNEAVKGGEQTKLELLKEEFEKTLAGLPEDVRFDLWVYRYPSTFPPKPELTRAFGRLQPASRGNLKKASSWLARQEALGWGAFSEPLEAALFEEVDSVYLLSDGRPSRGRLDRDYRILSEFPRLNHLRFLAVNTILVGDVGADRKFMESLAELTGGRFRQAGSR